MARNSRALPQDQYRIIKLIIEEQGLTSETEAGIMQQTGWGKNTIWEVKSSKSFEDYLEKKRDYRQRYLEKTGNRYHYDYRKKKRVGRLKGLVGIAEWADIKGALEFTANTQLEIAEAFDRGINTVSRIHMSTSFPDYQRIVHECTLRYKPNKKTDKQRREIREQKHRQAKKMRQLRNRLAKQGKALPETDFEEFANKKPDVLRRFK